jgi:hypothetical protein
MLEVHGEQRVGLKVGNRHVLGEDELWKARPSSGDRPSAPSGWRRRSEIQLQALSGGKPWTARAHIYALRHVPEGSAGALCETPGDADTFG